MEGSGETLLRQTNKILLIPREHGPIVELISWDYVGALADASPSRGFEKPVEPVREIPARYDVNVRQKNVKALAILPGEIPHVVLWVHTFRPPLGRLRTPQLQYFLQDRFRFPAFVFRFRQPSKFRRVLAGGQFILWH